MSLNNKLAIKLVRGEEIRLMHAVPNTWTELQAALKTMYGSSDFHITYIDEENDQITIASDLDLSEAYTFSASKPSLKLYLKPLGLVEDFEDLKIEEKTKADPVEPPFANRCGPEQFWNFRGRGRCGRGGFFKGMRKKFKKFMKHHNKMIKLKVLHKNFPKHWVVAAGSVANVNWTVMNKGKLPWPLGSYLMDFDGEAKLAEKVEIGEVKPGEVLNITARIIFPQNSGKFKGKWALMVGQECAGLLKAKFHVSAESDDSKVLSLVSMGFDKEVALMELQRNGGNLELAISKLLKSL